MHEFITEKILKGNPFKSYLIIYSPLIIGLFLFLIEPIILGKTGRFPLIIHFFPFLFLLFQIIWMETTSSQLLTKLKKASTLNVKRMKNLFRISKWSLLIISVQSSLTVFIMSSSLTTSYPFITYTIMGLSVVLMIFMLISYYTIYSGSNFLGNLLVEIESSKDDIPTGNSKIHLVSISGLLPFGYIKTHNRIKKIINQP